MPPVTPQGSRAALITWSVVTAFLFLICLTFAFYFYLDASDARQRLSTLTTEYNEILPESAVNRQDITEIKSLRGQEGTGLTANMSVVDALITQRNNLAALVGGTGANPVAASNAAREALGTASTQLQPAGLTLPASENLTLAVRTLATGLQARLSEIDQLKQDLNAAKEETQRVIRQTQDTIAAMQQQVDQIRQEQQEQQAAVAAYQQQKDTQVGQIEQQRASERQAALQQQQQAQENIRQLQDQIAELTTSLDAMRLRFSGRQISTTDPLFRQADGHVIRVPSPGVVYVDLGQRDSLVPGMTFEVYDQANGVPALSTLDLDQMPEGKASIEITRVGATSSEARVIRSSSNTVITEGDPIANLVFDKNTKYNFMVYGDFDLDQNGVATPQDTELIRRLVTQWGGQLTDQVNVNTDFVVLGVEPVLPSFSREELQDPFNARRLADAQAALEQYLDIRDKASDLRIPILNQNRFLYLIGYYSQAGR